MNDKTESKYILLSMEDATALSEFASAFDALPERVAAFVKRLESDTGGDFTDIAKRLMKMTDLCPACVNEGQGESCYGWRAAKQGRRIRRLIARADGTPEPHVARTPPKPSRSQKGW